MKILTQLVFEKSEAIRQKDFYMHPIYNKNKNKKYSIFVKG